MEQGRNETSGQWCGDREHASDSLSATPFLPAGQGLCQKGFQGFYRALLADGLPKHEAKALRDEYGAGMSMTSLIRELSRRSR